jgi:hypothetical protein
MADAWRLAGGGAAAGLHVVSAVTRQPARSVKRSVPLTCGPSCLFKLICFLPKLQLHNSQTRSSQCPKIFKLCMMLELIILTNFSHWVPFQFSTEFKL